MSPEEAMKYVDENTIGVFVYVFSLLCTTPTMAHLYREVTDNQHSRQHLYRPL
jgi:hypothetical protein